MMVENILSPRLPILLLMYAYFPVEVWDSWERFPMYEVMKLLICLCRSYSTTFAKVPMGAMVMRISSPLRRVKSLGGTMPVPVIR